MRGRRGDTIEALDSNLVIAVEVTKTACTDPVQGASAP
jgi:hypothetical protein